MSKRRVEHTIYNLEAERALLASLLMHPELIDAPGMPSVAHYHDQRHQLIALSLIKHAQDAGPVDLTLLMHEIDQGGYLEMLDGGAYLREIVESNPIPQNAAQYADVVTDLALKRLLQMRAQDLLVKMEKGDPKDLAPAPELLEGFLDEVRSSFEEHARAEWETYTAADALAEREPRQYVIEGLLRLPSVSILYGAPGGLKTMLLVDAALAVASGQPWLEPLPGKDEDTARQTTQAPVLWCDFDNGGLEMHERIGAGLRARGLGPDTPIHYVCFPSPWLDMSTWGGARLLLRRIKSLDARLVIVDNLIAVSGGVDENSAEMGNVMSHFRRVAEVTGAAIVPVHHDRKETGFGRKGDALRGHSSINGAVDLALKIEREGMSDQLSIEATKTRGVEVWPFGAIYTYEHQRGSTNLHAMRFWGTEETSSKSNAAIRRAILETVKATPDLNKGDVTDRVAGLKSVGSNRVRSQIAYLEGDGKLVVTDGPRNAKLYRLPSDDPHDGLG